MWSIQFPGPNLTGKALEGLRRIFLADFPISLNQE
jgi:hypothetical protein